MGEIRYALRAKFLYLSSPQPVPDHHPAVFGIIFSYAYLALWAQRPGTPHLVVDLVDEAAPIEVPGATARRVEGPRQWLSFPSDASAAPAVAAVAAYDVADLSIRNRRSRS